MSVLDPGGRFILIAGPCLLEDDRLNIEVAEKVGEVARRLGVPAIFKASFDKANRTSGSSPRGPGLTAGMERLSTVRRETGLPVLTDIHEPGQARAVAPEVASGAVMARGHGKRDPSPRSWTRSRFRLFCAARRTC